MEDGIAEASLAMGDGGQAAISLTSDIDGMGSRSLVEPVIYFIFLLYNTVKYLLHIICYTSFATHHVHIFEH